jgi:hypothetical protein
MECGQRGRLIPFFVDDADFVALQGFARGTRQRESVVYIGGAEFRRAAPPIRLEQGGHAE